MMSVRRRDGTSPRAPVLLTNAALAGLASSLQDKMTAIPTPEQKDAIVLDTERLPGAAAEEGWHSQYGSVFVRNVSIATLTPFLPAKGTGAAVILAPGGGFRTLSMQNQGWDVARALAKKGVAAFVLKYRLNPTSTDLEEFAKPAAPKAPVGAKPPRNSTRSGDDVRPSDRRRKGGVRARPRQGGGVERRQG